MDKNVSKKLTVAELLVRKEQIKNKKAKTITLYVASLDGEIEVQEPSREVATEALTMAADDTKSDFADIHVLYNCVTVPNLKDEQLQKEFGCVEPTDIVSMLFLPGEIASISGHALQMAGYGSGVKKVDAEIKN